MKDYPTSYLLFLNCISIVYAKHLCTELGFPCIYYIARVRKHVLTPVEMRLVMNSTLQRNLCKFVIIHNLDFVLV